MADDPSSTSPTPDTPPPRTTGGGFRWEPPTAEELQAMMPGYTIEKILGRGGMGAVYKGVQENLDRTVAIKILPPGVEKEDPSFAERFKSEARLMAKLNHPGVVAVYDFGKTSGGQLYFAMEYVDGTDVAQMIKTQGKLSADYSLAITAHVCDALGAAHELGIVHRDIKPANVLLNMKGQVKVADFGLAKVEEPGSHGLTKTGYAMGTPDFVAPEVLMLGTAIDGRADLYAVGVMLYQMLTGEVPRGAFKPASVLVPGLDRRYDPIIMKAMQSDRAERYQSSAELRRDLDVILTVPLVQMDASTGQSAIPAAQVAQAPGQRSMAQKPVGKPPQQSKGSADTPVRSSTPSGAAAKPKEAGKSAHAPLAPTKSNTPLFAGLGIAAVLGIAAFVMFSGGKKTPPATVGDSAPTSKPASVASSTPKPAASTPSSSKPAAEPWQELVQNPAKLLFTNSAKLTADGLVFSSPGSAKIKSTGHGAELRDGAVRVRLAYGGMLPQLQVRERSNVGHYWLHFYNETRAVLGRRDSATGKETHLASFTLPEPLKHGDEYEMELRVQGHSLTALINGKVMGSATDETLDAGLFGVLVFPQPAAAPSVIKSFQFLDLDAPGKGSASPAPTIPSSPSLPVSKSSDPKFPPGQWVKLFTKAEDLPEDLRKVGVKFEDGWIRSEGAVKKSIRLHLALFSNCGVRARFIRGNRSTSLSDFNMRCASVEGYFYKVRMDSSGVLHASEHEGDHSAKIFTSERAAPVLPGKEYTLEAAVVGQRVIGRQGDSIFSSGTVAKYQPGRSFLLSNEDVRDIEVINLDGLNEAEALKILGVDEKGNDLRKPAAVASATPTPPVSKSPPLRVPASSDKFPPGQWVKVFTKFEDLPEELRKGNFSLKWEEGWMRCEIGKPVRIYAVESLSNYAIRATMQRQGKEYQNKRLVIRAAPKPSIEGYTLRLDSTTLSAGRTVDGSVDGDDLWKAVSPVIQLPRIGEEYTLEWGCVGDKLIGRLGKDFVKVVTDTTRKSGQGYFTGGEPIRDIEVINLDGLSEAEALKILGVDEKGNDTRAAAVAQEKQAMEQAKVVDAASAIPELKVLHDQFVKLTAERVTAPFEADVAKLNAGYIGGIDRKITEEKAAGHLDGIIALEAEKKLLADKQPIPSDDAEGTTANLKALRTIYRAAYAKIEATRVANLKQLTDPLTLRLKQLEADLTKKDRVPDAKTVREYREGLGKSSPDLQVGQLSSKPSTTEAPQNGLKSGSTLKKFPPGDDRKAAEWVLSVGGRVRLTGGTEIISDIADLPRGRFEVVQVYLEFTSTNQPKSPIDNLLPLAGLKGLTRLQVKQLSTREAHWEILPSLPELGALVLERTGVTDAIFAQLAATKVRSLDLNYETVLTGEGIEILAAAKSLEKLVMYNFKPSVEGLRQIGRLGTLTYLSLSGAGDNIRDEHLPLLAGLKNLDSLLVRRSAITAEALAGMKQWSGLTTLGFDIPPGSTATQAALLAKAFPKVETLYIEGEASWDYGAVDISALAALTRLRLLSFTSSKIDDEALSGVLALPKMESLRFANCAKVTDAALETFGGHKALASLSFESMPNITDAGLAHLTSLRSLTKLELKSCPKLTETALAAFKKERPDVTVTK